MASNHQNFRNLHRLLGIQHTDVNPSHPVPVAVIGHPIPMGHGLYASSHPHIVAMGNGLTAGSGLYSGGGTTGGKLSPIASAFNKAFNPQKNGVAQAVQKTIVAPIQHDLVNPIVNTANQVKTGFNKTFTPQVGKDIVTDLKTTARYAIPAFTGFVGGALGGLATGGVGSVLGSAGGAYAGYKIDQALGIQGSNDFVGVPNGKGLKKRGRPRKSKGGTIKQELQKVYNKIPKEFHEPLEDLGRAGIEYAGYKLPPKKRTPIGSTGKGVKGSKSKTHKGDMDYTTKKGDKYFHENEHLEMGTPYEEQGMGIKRHHKSKGNGMKGSQEMKEKMARLRAMRGKKVKGGEIHQLPVADHVRLSPYQNF
jgi:hypothetical protein